ncbi:MAG: hypothetical protein P4L90_18140 [Rhodopila sp.]|nr:hypothetical protein [Rhodopila sp.]
MSDAHQATATFNQAHALNEEQLTDCIRACGFDAEWYLKQNVGLLDAGINLDSALLHFLAHGYNEHRDPLFGAISDGLETISSLAIPDRRYAAQLVKSVFFGQLRNPGTPDRLWAGVDGGLIQCVRDHGGLPYFIIGDSHTNHYKIDSWIGTHWLAPLPIVCHGASAIGLANENSRSQYGQKILRWAASTAGLQRRFDVPVFLKFGGIDAEFLWISRRIQKGIHHFSVSEFSDFARESVAKYGQFMDTLATTIDPALLRVCSVFPSVLTDASWTAGYIDAHKGSTEDNRQLADGLRKLEIPNSATRTKLRAIYNSYLEDLCTNKGLKYVDDFSPFLDPSGSLDSRYLGAHKGTDFHLDLDSSSEPLLKIIRASLAPANNIPTGEPAPPTIAA